MAELVAAFVALLFSVGQCPKGWSLGEGIRRTGEYACYSPVGGCWERIGERRPDGTFARVQCPPPTITRHRIHCTNGQTAIVINERTVGCSQQRR